MKISLPEGYIFDILSIYQIKICKSTDDKVNLSNFNNLKKEIEDHIGTEKMLLIINSIEYAKLLEANLKTFKLVDDVKSNPCLGRDVDRSNYERFLAKKALQEKYFNSNYSEIKIGYK